MMYFYKFFTRNCKVLLVVLNKVNKFTKNCNVLNYQIRLQKDLPRRSPRQQQRTGHGFFYCIDKTCIDETCINNYRPISLLPIFAKLIEKLMSIRLLKHFRKT